MIDVSEKTLIFWLRQFKNATGGPTKSIVGLTNALAKHSDLHIEIWTDEADDDVLLDLDASIVVKQRPIFVSLFNVFFAQSANRRIILNEVWAWYNVIFVFPVIWRRCKISIFPRGMLLDHALQQKRLKKILFWKFFQMNFFFRLMDSILVTSVVERNALLTLMPFLDQNKLFTIGNGLSSTELTLAEELVAARKVRRSGFKSKVRFVFFSRIHEQKGIFDLIEAFTGLDSSFELHICGTGDPYNLNLLDRKLVGMANVFYHGLIPGSKRLNFLSQFDVFILPTNGENFGNSILEALALELFVAVSGDLHWKDFGYNFLYHFDRTDLSPDLIKGIASIYLSRSPDDYKLHHILSLYRWENIAEGLLKNALA